MYFELKENRPHGTPENPFSQYHISDVKRAFQIPVHWHDELELIYIKKGMGRITVDFREYKVKGPTLALILPGQLHSIDQLEDAFMEYENIIFNPSMLIPRQNDVTATDFLLPLMSGKVTVPTIFTPVYPYYTDVIMPIDACDEISKTKPQGYELYIKSQLYQFFFILDNRCRNLTTGSNRKTLDKMKIVLKYIENNYMQKITIADIAATVDFSESHFMRYFKETMGTSFVDYLRDYRLTIASRLLTTSDSSILDIAAESGFENLSYFNRVFKQKYSMTPRQFRKESQ